MLTSEPSPALAEALAERILVLDGATGTYIQALDLSPDDFGGEALDGCNENLVLSRPDLVRRMHLDYLRAGADIVETNTFGATPVVLAEYGLADRAREINARAAGLAREACEEVARGGRPRFVAGSMGPTTRSLSVTGGITFDELLAAYREQALGLVEGGADFLLLETCQDTLNVKAAIIAVEEARAQLSSRIPLAISCTLEPTGTMLAGQDIESFWTSVEHARPLFVGMNCSTGPEAMTDHLRALAEIATCPTSCYPNAGLPDENGCYHESPEHVAARLRHFAVDGWLNLVGGCCGTTAEHVKLLRQAVDGLPPRRPAAPRGPVFSGLEAVAVLPENRPLLVGERTNVIGSRRFRQLVHAGDHDSAAEMGRRQVRGGAQLLDVCLSDPDRDETSDMLAVLKRLVRKVRVPLLIDTTDKEVLEAALEVVQGKAIVNSINLENGLERFESVVPIVRRHGAAVVVGCIDDDPQQGMAITRQRKVEIARKSVELLVHQYGLREQDIVIDPLVFPAGTGDVNHLQSARETIEGVRLIKEALPNCSTILGISNVSFGLPEAAREVVNSVFLYLCTKAGLDMAIVNSERVQRYASLTDEERHLAEDLLLARKDDALAAITTHFRGKRPVSAAPPADMPVEQRLARHVVEGVQDGLVAALEEARAKWPPLEVINGPLMTGMDEVGRLFNANELIVAEVLQSAEVMKAAVSHLQQFMEKADTHSRGKIVLATVRGDVHDIGKNLVEIILANNGYVVVNLGIKVLPETLVRAAREHAPDAIGLSGLLVKSAKEMVVTATSFREAGLAIPVLVGGAALTRRFTLTRIQPEYAGPVLYCSDATAGLEVLNKMRDPGTRETLLLAHRRDLEAAQQAIAQQPVEEPAAAPSAPRAPLQAFRRNSPPDLVRHEMLDVDFATVEPWLNEQALYGKHLGLRGVVTRLFEEGDARAVELRERVQQLMAARVADGTLRVRACWRFFPAIAEGDSVLLLERAGGQALGRFDFPRQPAGDRLCLSDFVASSDAADPDHVALFVTTCGASVRESARALIDAGRYVEGHALQAVALEGAEAAAEWLHATLRRAWGFADPPGFSRNDAFRAKYRGLRVSFGYPACPRLEDQRTLFDLLRPEGIGVSLTEGFMMEPEASVSALVFQHPQARYFSVAAERA
jgi:5-methyltetrahydrofolate--homocysteine methyltransferase